MPSYKFQGALMNEGWISPAFVRTDDQGILNYISDHAEDGIQYETVNGYAIPGFQNAHSHAFQYAMAGLAEKHVPGVEGDDFWSWREAMYQIALTMDPDQLEAVASMLYAEMVRHGYTHVAEFHYLHHDRDGKPFSNLAEMGSRLISAANNAGIKITLVPMFYQMGGFGMEPQPRQKRFISSAQDDYYKLLESTKVATNSYHDANYGFGIHSLRAVRPDDITSSLDNLNEQIPIHIHISEQLKEIEDAKSYLGARPVEWLLDNCHVNDQFHLVHATHLVSNEVNGIAKSGAYVVLCPTTEGNLGDGIFPLQDFQKVDGKWSIGTDSHVSLNPLEELRMLDYGQRLISHQRNIFTSKKEGDSGKYGIDQALISGRRAMNNMESQYFSIGQSFDAVVYDADFPLLAASSLEHLSSTIIYSCDSHSTLGTIVNGNWVVKNQKHTNAETIKREFIDTIKALKIR